ncbi:cupin domain-containing protein [Neorhizobium sp. P12A]|nr:cupin domain-containing protein [Neorhizobium sp. P12A]
MPRITLVLCYSAGIEPISHQGEELGYVLEGEITLTVDGKTYQVPVGASFHFRSKEAHGFRNLTQHPAKILWVSTPPTF